jgi:hypothetical protein
LEHDFACDKFDAMSGALEKKLMIRKIPDAIYFRT